jgi:hypothetical protein
LSASTRAAEVSSRASASSPARTASTSTSARSVPPNWSTPAATALAKRPRIGSDSTPHGMPRSANDGRWPAGAPCRQRALQSLVIAQSVSTSPRKPYRPRSSSVRSWRLNPAPTGSTGRPFTVAPWRIEYVGITPATFASKAPRKGRTW